MNTEAQPVKHTSTPVILLICFSMGCLPAIGVGSLLLIFFMPWTLVIAAFLAVPVGILLLLVIAYLLFRSLKR